MELPLERAPVGRPIEHSCKFTLDDIPPSQWRARFQSLYAWLTTDLQQFPLSEVLKRIIARFEGRLRDYYTALGKYQQLQFLRLPSPEEVIKVLKRNL